MRDPDELVAECVQGIAEAEPRGAIREVLDRAVRSAGLTESLRLKTPTAGLDILYNTPDLTVLNVVWPPLVSLFPHDHRMWAAIGIYGGREDNAFYRRHERTIVASGGKELHVGDVLLLGDDAIHGVTNPAQAYTGAIHVYGGDFLGTPRSQWDSETLEEEPYDLGAVQQVFAEAEARFTAGQG
ncbi:MAG: hypothetical protein HYU28_11050 [Actinobacteria bacterium]|nr:hypothetical protein [Actinomycetota bacterium]